MELRGQGRCQALAEGGKLGNEGKAGELILRQAQNDGAFLNDPSVNSVNSINSVNLAKFGNLVILIPPTHEHTNSSFRDC